MRKVLMILAVVVGLAALICLADPTPIEDACTTGITLTNGIGRAYEIESFYTKTRADTTTQFSVVIAVANLQDQDLTGTNATQAVVTYVVKRSGTTSNVWTWTPDELVRVPDGAALVLAYAGGTTNDFLIFRDDVDD